MSTLALQAYICTYLHENDILYFYDFKRRFKLLGRFDLIEILNNDQDFSLRVKKFLFNRRIRGVRNGK